MKLNNAQLHNLCVLSNGGDHVKENQTGTICSRHDSSGTYVHFCSEILTGTIMPKTGFFFHSRF